MPNSASYKFYRFQLRICFWIGILILGMQGSVNAQFSLGTGVTSYSQNFNNLGTSINNNVSGGSLNNLSTGLNGWYFNETGANANTTITAGTGSSATGDTYNFGVLSGSDRTLGGLRSGNVIPTFGFYFINNTGSTITSLAITYTGETWRRGTASRTDQLDFQYSTNATSLTTGSWTDFNSLDYVNTAGATASGSLLQSATITATLGSLSITDGSTFFIRWNDLDVTGADDGMGINNFSFTTSGTGSSPTIDIATVHPSTANISPASSDNLIAVYKLSATNGDITPSQITFTTAGTFTSSDIANFKVYQNSLSSLSGAVQVGTDYTGLSNGGSFTPNTNFSAITAGNVSYILITTDVQSIPINNRKVNIAANALSNFTFTTSPVVTGTDPATVGNTFTINTSTFTAGSLAVLSIAGTTNSAQTTSILQYNTSGTGQTGLTTVSFPDGASGTRLTQSGNATSEGDVNLSSNGTYLVCAGYDAALATASVASGTANGIVGRVAANGNYNISTSFNRVSSTFIGNNIRSACSDDGTRFWASGPGNSSSGGVWYITLGATSGTQLSTTVTNTRSVNIFNGQLYTSMLSGSLRLASIGTGTPTTGTSQTFTNLPGFLTTTGDPYAFVFFDRDASVAGVDLLYCASLGSTSPGGILKYSFDGTTWTARGSITGNVRGITATLNCAGYIDLFVTVSASTTVRPNTLYKFTDQALYNASITSDASAITSVGSLLATAASGTLFGGVAFTPMPDVTVSSNQSLAAGTYRNITINSNVLTLTGDITVLGDIVVNNGATLDCGAYHIFNNPDFRSTFVLNSGATLRTADPNGITASAASGAIQTCGTRTYNAAANYVFKGSANQVTGDGLPSTVTGSVTINNSGTAGDNSVTLTTSGSTFSTLNLNAGNLLIGIGKTLNIANNGSITANGGDFASGTSGGTLNFPGVGTITTTTAFNPYNVSISGAVNFGTATNINGTLQINSTSASITTNPPSYATNSILQYNSGSTFARGLEWSATSNAGYPYNVQVSNSTTLNYPNGTVVARAMEGSLTIDNGSILNMGFGSPGNNLPLTINGSVINNGTFILGDASGGDVNVGKDWTRGSTGTFTPASRIVSFVGGSAQSINITGGGTEIFDNLTITNPNFAVSQNCNVTVAQILTLNNILSIGNNNLLTLNGTITGTGSVTGSATSNLTIGGTTGGSVGTLNFTSGAQNLYDFVLSRTGTGANAVLGTNLSVVNTFNNAAASFTIGANTLTLNGSLTGSGSFTGSFSSNLSIGGSAGTNIGTLLFTTGAQTLNNLTISRTGANAGATLGTDLLISNILDITNAAAVVTMGSNTLQLNGTVTGNGSLTGSSTSNLIIGGAAGGNLGSINFTSGARLLNTITMNRTGGSSANPARAVLGTDLVADAITLTNGILATGNNLFTYSQTGTLTAPNISGTTWTTGTNFADSYIATCDNAGTPLTTTDGTKGFRINSIGSNINMFFPVGADFNGANRMMINNNGTTDNYTVVVGKGDIGNTPKPMVNRIWYVNEGTPGGSKVTMRLFFKKINDPSGFMSNQDEVEAGFIYSDVRLVQETTANQFVNNANGIDIQDFTSGFADGTEIYGQYTRGVSTNIDNSANPDGVIQFTRFSVVNANNVILPVTITQLKASLINSSVHLTWTSVSEYNIAQYQIERSGDGTHFEKIGTLPAQQNGNQINNYTFIDALPISGQNYYRIKIEEKDGSSSYSNIVLLMVTGNSFNIIIAPNPVVNHRTYIRFMNAAAGKYTLTLYSGNGQLVYQNTLLHGGGSSAYLLHLPAELKTGIYFMRVTGNQMQVLHKLMVE